MQGRHDLVVGVGVGVQQTFAFHSKKNMGSKDFLFCLARFLIIASLCTLYCTVRRRVLLLLIGLIDSWCIVSLKTSGGVDGGVITVYSAVYLERKTVLGNMELEVEVEPSL
jgi:hypothetical protein